MTSARHIRVSRFPLQKWHAQHPPAEHVPQPPQPWTPIDLLHARAIIMPWLSTGATWQELRYALRSIHTHFTDRECPIYLLCDCKPYWLESRGRLVVREMPGYRSSNHDGLAEAWEFGCQIASEVAWWNDDIYLLRDTGWEDLRVALTEGELEDDVNLLRASTNGWRRALGDTVEDLHKQGFDRIMRFATHTPYLFEATKAREIAATYHLPFSGAFETLYHTHHNTAHEPCAPYKTDTIPCARNPRYLNHGRYGPNESTKAELERLFHEPAPWECAQPLTAPVVVSGKIPVLVSMASFPPRSAGLERVVADILPQCDGLRLYLNGYDQIPSFIQEHPKLDIILAGPGCAHPDLGSHGKWHWLGREDCHHLTVDDDIFYADNYVAHMVAACQRLGDRAIVGLHGYRFRFLRRGALLQAMPVARSRQMRFYHSGSDADWPVHALGSGVMCCRPAMIGLQPEHLNGDLHSGDDEDLAIWAQRKKIPMVRVASPSGLALPNDTEWRKDPLHARPEFREVSDKKIKSYTSWTLHTL